MGQIWTKKINVAIPETGQMITALVPVGNSDEFEKLKINEDHMIQTKRVRSPPHHRKFFALIRLCFDNQEEIDDEKNHRQVFQMRCGLVDRVVTKKGVIYLPRSISFENMDQTTFEDLWIKALAHAEEMLGSSSAEIRNALADFY
jgi:hypothetical protein